MVCALVDSEKPGGPLNPSKLSYSVLPLFLAVLMCGCGEQAPITQPVFSRQTIAVKGVVDDWSTHHVRFSNPGTEADAIKAGRHAQWLRVMNDPRFQIQQAARNRKWPTLDPVLHRERFRRAPMLNQSGNNIHRDWVAPITPVSVGGGGDDTGAFPAKYGFDIKQRPPAPTMSSSP